MKYVLVTGGVISGIGKGIIASSTGLLLKSTGLRVTAIKIDPYLNLDAGTMNPIEHGEVFVLDDGGEVDLDLGNYERFLETNLGNRNNITTGKIYNSVINGEREGKYLGKTVQVIPHVTNEIQDWVREVANAKDADGEVSDVCIIELGGTVGDIESAPFVEAMRQFQFQVGNNNFCLIHVSLVPLIGSVGEQKTKPTQASVRDLRGLGLSPDLIMCRSEKALEPSIKEKISMFCHVPTDRVFGVHDCNSIYQVPLLLESQKLLNVLEERLDLPAVRSKLNLKDVVRVDYCKLLVKWKVLAERDRRPYDNVKVSIIGKYTGLHDSYLSVIKALEHASLACNRKLEIVWINSEDLEEKPDKSDAVKYHEAWRRLCDSSGILVPGGFGSRGTEGKIAAIKWAREHKVPYLGICLGLQLAVIEFARNVLNIKDATSEEFVGDAKEKVVVAMPEVSTTHMGGTMRLGRRVSIFAKENSVARKLYNSERVYERHRHRYEVNTKYVPDLEKHGLRFVAHDELVERMEIMELANHPYFVATQFHPEFMSRPLKPSPVFFGFILAICGLLKPYLDGELPELGRYSTAESKFSTPTGSESSISTPEQQELDVADLQIN